MLAKSLDCVPAAWPSGLKLRHICWLTANVMPKTQRWWAQNPMPAVLSRTLPGFSSDGQRRNAGTVSWKSTRGQAVRCSLQGAPLIHPFHPFSSFPTCFPIPRNMPPYEACRSLGSPNDTHCSMCLMHSGVINRIYISSQKASLQ